MREKFEDRKITGQIIIKLDDARRWVAEKERVVAHIISIVNDYAKQGYRLTLRQLYYQLVAADAIPNHDKVYKKIGTILDDCRYSGLLDWSSIEDRGRVPKLPYSVEGIKDALTDTIEQYRLDRQEGQENHIELWTEKDAISNILFGVTASYHVRLVVNKGYTSSSAIYSAYDRFTKILLSGRKVVILYFGDHDPSGLDMVRDIEDRLLVFFSQGSKLTKDETFYDGLRKWWFDEMGYTIHDIPEDLLSTAQANRLLSDETDDECADAFEAAQFKMYLKEKDLFKVIPIGLTKAQITRYKLPPNPAKITDPRAKDYIRKHGQTSWEVDALRPDVLTRIVNDNILELLDFDQYKKVVERENAEKKQIKKFADKYK